MAKMIKQTASNRKIQPKRIELSPARRELFRELCIADIPEAMAEMLENGRPIARRLWNPYLEAASAPNSKAYARSVLKLAFLVTEEIERLENSATDDEAKSIRALAAEMEYWPVKITKFARDLKGTRARVDKLGLGPKTGRIKAPQESEVLLFGRRLFQLASESVLNFETHKTLFTRKLGDPAKEYYFGRRHWDYHYIVLSPPPITQEHRVEWELLGTEILSIYHGTKEIRREARARFLGGQISNPHLTPKAPLTAQRIVSKSRNMAEKAPEFLQRSLDNWDEQDSSLAESYRPNPDFPEEQPPCLLGLAIMRERARKVKMGSGDRGILKSADAIYRQIAKDVVDAFLNGLPKQ